MCRQNEAKPRAFWLKQPACQGNLLYAFFLWVWVKISHQDMDRHSGSMLVSYFWPTAIPCKRNRCSHWSLMLLGRKSGPLDFRKAPKNCGCGGRQAKFARELSKAEVPFRTSGPCFQGISKNGVHHLTPTSKEFLAPPPPSSPGQRNQSLSRLCDDDCVPNKEGSCIGGPAALIPASKAVNPQQTSGVGVPFSMGSGQTKSQPTTCLLRHAKGKPGMPKVWTCANPVCKTGTTSPHKRSEGNREGGVPRIPVHQFRPLMALANAYSFPRDFIGQGSFLGTPHFRRTWCEVWHASGCFCGPEAKPARVAGCFPSGRLTGSLVPNIGRGSPKLLLGRGPPKHQVDSAFRSRASLHLSEVAIQPLNRLKTTKEAMDVEPLNQRSQNQLKTTKEAMKPGVDHMDIQPRNRLKRSKLRNRSNRRAGNCQAWIKWTSNH